MYMTNAQKKMIKGLDRYEAVEHCYKNCMISLEEALRTIRGYWMEKYNDGYDTDIELFFAKKLIRAMNT